MMFDLRTVEGTKKFIIDWLGIHNDSLMKYVLLNCNEINVDNFCEEYEIDLDNIGIEDLTYIASHVTTCSDELESIQNYGLLDLKLTLSLPTPLQKFLKEHGVEFDIEKKTMKIYTETFDISYKKKNHFNEDSLEGELQDIARRLFYDSQISAFLSMQSDKKYGGIVHERPEILYNISKVSKKNLETYWKKNNKAFVLEYKENFENFEWYTFYVKEEEYYEDSTRINHKKWLVKKALYRLWNDLFHNDINEEYAYMKSSYTIPWKNVINVRKII